jgi:xanthine/CO dehydrogenase XdhC/CoxF family maturation factor
MNRRETERILGAIRDAQAAGLRAALATVVRVRGSAYRREGARILVRDDGSYECLLSGGCLEPAVVDTARRVIATGTPALVQYDLDDDSVWSLGIGCSGAIDVLIERLEHDEMSRSWFSALERGDAAVLVKPLNGSTSRLLVRADEAAGTLGDAALDREAVVRARRRLETTYPRAGTETIGGADYFFDVSTPPPALVLFGAGHDVVPLADQAWALGFRVTVVDVREAFLQAERFPHATMVAAHFTRFAEAVPLTANSYVVTMNHHLERDREALRFALDSPAPYVGVLGPRSRLQKLLDGLAAGGYVADPGALARVRSPVGLALGAETPEEIAVSILAEILAVQRGFEGGFLTGREASLHVHAGYRL